MDVLLGLSHEFAYFKDRGPVSLQSLGHDPWFWVLPKKGQDPGAVLRRIRTAWQEATRSTAPLAPDEQPPIQKIKAIGDLETVKSFSGFGGSRPAFKVFSKRSYFVPEISDELFYAHDVFTAEHDVPYQQRACVDLCAKGEPWPFDTRGQKTKLKVLVYDIETTQFASGVKRVPVDMIGWSEFEFSYEASKDLDREEFHFNLVDAPPAWQDCPVPEALEARTLDEEVENLLKFVRRIPNYHIIAGHNILGFDNREIHERINQFLSGDERQRTLSQAERRAFEEFTTKWSAKDRTYSFGQQTETVNFFPTSLDTYHAARRFYFFLDDFSLKKVAPFLGVKVPDRVYLSPNDLKLGDARTREYNKHDVQEQLGITMLLLAQALPMAFTTGWTFEELLTGGNVRIWDHMAMIRAARQRKLMPATCRAQGVARTVLKNLGTRPTKERIADDARGRMRQPSPPSWLKEYVRVAKYGDEMPDWVELPHVIINPKAVAEPENGTEAAGDDEEEEELLSYAIPGGMTLHPQEVNSQFIPWWYVVDADVGAMYPTILRARNVGPDTVRLAAAGETPDDWVWLYRVPEEFRKDARFLFREVTAEDAFAKPGEGIMVGVRIDKQPGLVPSAMKGIMGIATKMKRAVSAAKKDPNAKKAEIDRLAMAYASIKATRNAGTHGQMLAVNVSCRGFNLWAGAEITTIGQKILADTLQDLKRVGARVVYGDSIVGSRCVVVRNPRGEIEVLPIEELFRRTGGIPHQRHGKDAVLGHGWEALALDPTTPDGPPEWRPIRRVIRHEASKRVVRVGQTVGETVCTEDHSIMVRRGPVLERARPEESMRSPLVRVDCPRNPVLRTIDLAEPLRALTPVYEGMPKVGRWSASGPAPVVTRFGADAERVWFADASWFESRSRPPPTLRRTIKVGSPECASLLRLMGAYVSEGSVARRGSRHVASIANGDLTWLRALAQDYESLFQNVKTSLIPSMPRPRTIRLKDGRTSTYRDRTHKLQMSNQISTLFFEALAGRGSENKRIPSFVFNLPPRHQIGFLATLVQGDGSRKLGPRYRAEHSRHFTYTTKSLQLASGLCVLLSQLGMSYGTRFDARKRVYTVWTRGSERANPRSRIREESHEGPVYDLEVEGIHTFVDALGCVLLHNTDGIYLACSRSGKNLAPVSEALNVDFDPKDAAWILPPDQAVQAIQDLNRKWRDYLGYEDFELEAGSHDAMLFVVHKNYLIFDVKSGKLKMTTKGNNFRGSDKAPVAQKLLEQIMVNALRDNIEWTDEEEARKSMRASISKWTQEAIKSFDPTTLDAEDLTLVQVVQPKSQYKANATGTSIWIKRAEALEKVTGERLKAPKKYRFVVCKKPLPGIEKPSKTGIKPLDYMWPLDALKDRSEIDLAWYKDMIQKYVRGAFGFEERELTSQKGLDAWM